MNGLKDNIAALREVSNNLEADPLAEYKNTLFPGWHPEYEGHQEKLVREAARGILADGVSPDNGTHVSQKALSALIHYIADMME
ncbi:MAG TPA: hypothetical protein VF571_09285 [Pyrinomonadaceae bacterium]|jgi:hypothetical protein